MSLAPSLTQASPVHRGRTGFVALCAVQVALAGMFLLAGSSKLVGDPAMVGLFDAIGIGQWFRYLTGFIEVGSALALLVPSFAVFGALALVPTMVGAVATHLFIVGGSPGRRSCCSGQLASPGLAGINSSATSRRSADDLNGVRDGGSK